MELGRLSRLQLYGIVSSTCFVWAILNAFRVRSNFYSAAVYLSKSNACMMVRLLPLPCWPGRNEPDHALRRHAQPRELTTSDFGRAQILWNQGIYQTVLFGKLMQAIFFGELRMIEVEVRASAPEVVEGRAARTSCKLTWSVPLHSACKSGDGSPLPRLCSPSPSSRTSSSRRSSCSSSACCSSRCSTGSPRTE
jgi:hypothetical protein